VVRGLCYSLSLSFTIKIGNYEKKSVSLLPESVAVLVQLSQVMTASHYSPQSIRNYVREMRFLLEYYPQLLPGAITDKHITAYMCYVKDVLLCGRDKCRGAAAAFSFTWKHVFKTPFDLPTKLYPKKAFGQYTWPGV
jgi:hypothetical protein